MKTAEMTEEDVLPALIEGGEARNRAFEHMHAQWRPLWYKMASTAGATPDEIDEAFATACLSVLKAVSNKSLTRMHTATFRTYFVRCVINAVIGLKRESGRQKKIVAYLKSMYENDLSAFEAATIDRGDQLLKAEQEKQALIRKLLDQVTLRCREILTAYYFEELKMEHVAVKMGFGTAVTARKEKSKCLKRIHEFLAAHPAFYERLKELLPHG